MDCDTGIHGPAHELRTKHYGLRFQIMICVPRISPGLQNTKNKGLTPKVHDPKGSPQRFTPKVPKGSKGSPKVPRLSSSDMDTPCRIYPPLAARHRQHRVGRRGCSGESRHPLLLELLPQPSAAPHWVNDYRYFSVSFRLHSSASSNVNWWCCIPSASRYLALNAALLTSVRA